jgi:hypothetical protein
MANGAGLLEDSGSLFDIVLFQRILSHPGNGALAVYELGTQTKGEQQRCSHGEELQAIWEFAGQLSLSNSWLLSVPPSGPCKGFLAAHLSGRNSGLFLSFGKKTVDFPARFLHPYGTLQS